MASKHLDAWRPPNLQELLNFDGHLTRSIKIAESHRGEDIAECSAIALPVASAYHRESLS